MARIAIAQPARTIGELLCFIVEQQGHTGEVYAISEPASRPDALILEPAWETGVAVAQRLRERDPNLPIICVSIRSETAESRALAPTAHVLMPFGIEEVAAAVRNALGP